MSEILDFNKCRQEKENHKQATRLGKLFPLLQKRGLLDFAATSFDDYALNMGIPNTGKTKRAYILAFSSLLEDYYDQDSHPLDIQHNLNSQWLSETQILKLHAGEFLYASGYQNGISEDLYSASIASPTIDQHPNRDNYEDIIGHKAFMLHQECSLLFQPDEGNGEIRYHTVSPEVKALYLSQVAELLNVAMADIQEDVHSYGKISPETRVRSANILGYVSLLDIGADTSLEMLVVRKVNTMQTFMAFENNSGVTADYDEAGGEALFDFMPE